MPNPPAVTFRGTSGTLVPLREHPTTPGEPMCSCVSRFSLSHTHARPRTLKHHDAKGRQEATRWPLPPGEAPRTLQAPLTLLQGQALHEGTGGHSSVGRQPQPRRLEAVFFCVQSSFLLPCNRTASQNDTVGGKKREKKTEGHHHAVLKVYHD